MRPLRIASIAIDVLGTVATATLTAMVIASARGHRGWALAGTIVLSLGTAYITVHNARLTVENVRGRR